MLLSTEKKDDLTNVIYESSNILTSSYNEAAKELTVVFKNGGQYKYKGVPTNDYLRFELAESQGKVLNSHIKKYPFEKLENVNVEPINAQILILKEGITNPVAAN